jgi:S-DNA-T family DNA segregation ATPase FtsK/SpoIIIE
MVVVEVAAKSKKRRSGTSRSTKGRTQAKRTTTARRTQRVNESRRRQMRDACGLGLIAFACYLAGVVWFAWQGGTVGAALEQASSALFGHAGYIFPLVILAVGILLIVRTDLVDLRPFRAGLWLLVPGLLLAFGADRFALGDGSATSGVFTSEVVAEHGGYIGAALYFGSYSLFGEAGTTIACLLSIAVGVLFLTGSSIQAGTRWWARRIGTAAVVAGQTSRHVAVRIGEATAEPLATARTQIQEGIAAVRAQGDAIPFDGAGTFPDIFGDVPAHLAHAASGAAAGAGAIEQIDSADEQPPRRRTRRSQSSDDTQLEMLQPVETGDDGGTSSVRKRIEGVSDTILRARVTDAYTLPDRALLRRASKKQNVEPKASEVERIKRLLVETFGHFGIEARVTGLVPGPRVSRYELSLAPGTKMSKVENLRKDLAYALATTEIRILAPIPGKSAVGIEIENASPGIVLLGDIVAERPKKATPLHVWLGRDIDGDVVGADLAEMPHLLVAGTTGAGKSGCMNAMLSSLVLSATPDEVRLLLIDPKKVELSTYEGLPHLLTPVVTNMKKAANALGNVVATMEDRYASMEIAGARTLPEYNRIRMARGDDPVPYVVVVIDELADLMMQSRSDVEDAVIRVAQKGRAAGFHLVLATQRPSVDVITGMIKSNVPSRIAFAVSSQTDSRVILDQNGAETLLGKGDMLFKPVSKRMSQRVQGAWVSEQEVRAICDAARGQREPDYDVDLLADPEPIAADADAEFVDSDDRLPEAIRLVAEFQTCSASFFQRRMRVGYTRGARLVDMLERRGIVAPGEGPRPRTVLITMDDVPRLLESEGAAAAQQ